MRLFGLEFGRRKDKALNPVPGGGWHRLIHEPFTGAWQRNMEEKRGTVLCYPTLYACLNRISADIGKLPFQLKALDANGIWREMENPAYSPVLRKPNRFQTAQQFRESWILSKLIHGNAYILKARDSRRVVTDLYVLDPCRVMPMVSDNGDVYYQINYPSAQNLLPEDYPAEQLTIPASEIIHDRINCFHHPLVGVPPLCAAHWPAVKNLKILKNATEFFSNGARPGGILTAPAGISEEDANDIRDAWHKQYGDGNQGKIGLIGADLKYQDLGLTNGADSQLVEQMRYSDEQICQPFGIPPFKIGIGSIPAGLGVDAINLLYMEDALHGHIIAMETLLTEGLEAKPYRIGMPEDELLRMDRQGKATYHGTLLDKGTETINEARFAFGYGPLDGGDTVYMQQQDFPLNEVRHNKIEPASPEPVVEENPEQAEEIRRLTEELWQRKALESAREAING